MHSSTFGKGWVGMSACPSVVLACESLHVCTVCIWRCEHARFCVEVFYALYINFHSFIHSFEAATPCCVPVASCGVYRGYRLVQGGATTRHEISPGAVDTGCWAGLGVFACLCLGLSALFAPCPGSRVPSTARQASRYPMRSNWFLFLVERQYV